MLSNQWAFCPTNQIVFSQTSLSALSQLSRMYPAITLTTVLPSLQRYLKTGKSFKYRVNRVVPKSWQPAELTDYLGRLCRLLLWYIYIFKDKLFVPFPLQFIDLKIIWLAQRYMIISSLRWVLGITWRKKALKAWVYTNNIEKLWLLLELTLLEICAQNQGNSVSGDLKCKSFLGGHAPRPPRRDCLQCSITTILLLRNFCQLLEKLWTTLRVNCPRVRGEEHTVNFCVEVCVSVSATLPFTRPCPAALFNPILD